MVQLYKFQTLPKRFSFAVQDFCNGWCNTLTFNHVKNCICMKREVGAWYVVTLWQYIGKQQFGIPKTHSLRSSKSINIWMLARVSSRKMTQYSQIKSIKEQLVPDKQTSLLYYDNNTCVSDCITVVMGTETKQQGSYGYSWSMQSKLVLHHCSHGYVPIIKAASGTIR